MKKYLVLALFLVLGMAFAQAPSLSLSYEVTPSSINAGGTAQVIVTITNADTITDVENLKIELSSRIPGVSVTSGPSDIGDLVTGSSTSAAFAIRALQSAAPGTYIVEAKGIYEYGTGDKAIFKLNIPVVISYRSNLEIFVPNTQITPGATEDLLIKLNNAGKSSIRDLVVTLLAPTGSSVYSVGDIRNTVEVLQPTESGEVKFQIRASDTAITGIQPATISVTYTDAAGSTQSDMQSIGIIVVDSGTEVIIDSIESNLEPGKTGTVKIGLKNIGAVELENLYLSITTGIDLSISGSNEKRVESLGIGETKYVEFSFDVSQASEAKPVASTLTIKYQRDGGKKQITEDKSIGIPVNGGVDLQVIKVSVDKTNKQIEVDVANYGNKAADAVKVDAVAGDKAFGTGFTDTIKPNKHKVFRFDMPPKRDIVISMSYKDYLSESGEKNVTVSYTFSESEIAPPAGDGTGMIILFLIVIVIGVWWWRRQKRGKIKIDVSKYKENK